MEVSGRKEIITPQITDVKCDPCASTGETQTAEYFCTECNEYLCSSCAKVHRKFKATKDHQLLRQDEMPREYPSFIVELKCRRHENYPFDYFCQIHDQLCCSVCLNLEHRDCSIEYIKDLSDKFEQSGKRETLLRKLNDLDELAQTAQSKAERNIENANRLSQQIIDEVKKSRKEINDILDSLENKILENAKKIKDKDVQAMSQLLSELSAFRAGIKESNEKLEYYSKLNQKKYLTIATKLIDTDAASDQRKIEGLFEQNRIREALFCPNKNLLKVLFTEELGSLEVKDKGSFFDKETVTKVTKPLQESVDLEPLPVDISHERDIDIKDKQDKEACHIAGTTMIDSSTLALADFSNRCLKIVDLQTDSITSYMKLPFQPGDITCISLEQLVSTVPSLQSLAFIDICDCQPLTIKKYLKLDQDCYGICCIGNMLIVTFLEEGMIQFLSLNGTVLKNLHLGDPELYLANYVEVTPDGKYVFVSDCGQNTLTKLDMSGAVLDVYKGENLKESQGISIDTRGNVFVAGRDSNNICVLKAGSKQLKPVLHIDKPLSVLLFEASNQLIVSREDMDTLSVYNLLYL